MRRISVLVSLVAIVLLSMVVSGRSVSDTAAQDATSAAAVAAHPLVGTWILDTDATTAGDATGVITVSADGTYHEVDPDGTTGLGTWRPTGERTAVVTVLTPGDGGSNLIRATVEVAADGRTLTASYTFEVFGPDDSRTGEFGPGKAAGLRLEAEAPGAPVGTLADLFAQIGGETPAP